MKFITLPLIALVILSSCSQNPKVSDEQIRVVPESTTADAKDTINAVSNNLDINQIASYPRKVVLNGLPQHRLVTIYKHIPKRKERSGGDRSYSYYNYEEDEETDEYSHYMPGLDLIFGYNLVALAHYDMKSEQLNYLFNKPVLIKSVYYPSYVQDSVGEKTNRKSISRDYFLVSGYDEDTNKDTLLNRHDLRRFYHFNAGCDSKTQVIPPNYSVLRSQYDLANDVMYIYARHDADNNGKADAKEPVHIFWMSLKTPVPAKRLY